MKNNLQMKQLAIISILLLLSVCHSATAQTDRRYWNEGPLTWDDFTVMSDTYNNRSYLQYTMQYTAVHDTIDGILCHYYAAQAWITPKSSWIADNQRTPATLLYNQTIFDMLELERRLLQHSINAAEKPFLYSDLLTAASDHLNRRIGQFQQLTNDGNDTAVLSLYAKQVQKELALHPAVYRPQYSPHPLGYSFYIGLAADASTGTLGQTFGPTLCFNYGINLSWHPHLLILDGSIGHGKSRRAVTLDDASIAENSPYDVATIHFGYGLLLVNNNRVRLAPFAALGIREYSQNPVRNTRFIYARPEPVAGLHFQYSFWMQRAFPEYSSLMGNRRMSELSQGILQARLLASWSSFPRFDGSPTGLCLQAQVVFGFRGRLFIVQ